MAEHTKEFPISKMARLMKVSESGYYRWLNTPASAQTRTNKELLAAIEQVWGKFYGSPRSQQVLIWQGWQVSRGRVARWMRRHGIRSPLRKKWVVTTDSKHNYPVRNIC